MKLRGRATITMVFSASLALSACTTTSDEAGYNLISVPLAAGVLAPVGVVMPMSVGAVLMSLSTIVVAVNAQLLRRIDLNPESRALLGEV